MTQRFIKFIPSEEAMWLLKNRGHAFRLLTIIAESARRESGNPDGLNPGEAFIGGFENYDMTEQNYRSAKKILVERGHIEIKETCRTRKKKVTTENKSANTKVTTEVTTISTKVKLISSVVYDVNLFIDNDRSNEQVTTESEKGNDKQRSGIKKEERKEIDRTTTTKERKGGGGFYDCLKEIEIPEHRKEQLTKDYTEIRVEMAVKFVQHEDFVPTKGIMQTLVWHCKQVTPPQHAEKPRPEWERLAHKHNEIYRENQPKQYKKNKDLIKEQKLKIWQHDRFVPISLGNSIEVLKKDFSQAANEYKIALKNWKNNQEKVLKMEKFA